MMLQKNAPTHAQNKRFHLSQDHGTHLLSPIEVAERSNELFVRIGKNIVERLR